MYVVMNVVQTLEGRAQDFEEVFLSRERLLNQAPGFHSFELLRREEGGEYIVLTRWDSQDDFRAWVKSDLFRRSHRERRGDLTTSNELRAYEVLDVEVTA